MMQLPNATAPVPTAPPEIRAAAVRRVAELSTDMDDFLHMCDALGLDPMEDR